MNLKYFVEIDEDLIQLNRVNSIDNDLVFYQNLWTLENYSGEIFKRNDGEKALRLEDLDNRNDVYITNFLSKEDTLENLDYLHSIKDNIDDSVNFMTLKKSFTKTSFEEKTIPLIKDTGELIEYFNSLFEIIKNLQ